MMAKLSQLPAPEKDRDYSYEIKWDGIRAIVFVENGRLRAQSRNLLDLTNQYPELWALAASLKGRRAILDGEIVALDSRGLPSFELLQNRMGVTGKKVRGAAADVAATYMIFDLLNLDGKALMNQPYLERQKQLQSLGLAGPHWQTPGFHMGDGAALLQATMGKFEGLVAKKVDSIYEPGGRSGAWLKIKNVLRQECVIGGWLPGEGSRLGRIGALLTGYYDLSRAEAASRGTTQKLVYAGKVGTGFSDTTLKSLAGLLSPLQANANPFQVDPPRYKSAVFVKPELVGEFQFAEWTKQHIMRHPSFKGLRQDKDPGDVVREEVQSSE